MTAYAAIHAGLKQLGIDQDDARDLYERQTGKRSLRDMTPPEHESVIGELRRLGFKRASKPGANRASGPYAKKLQALWIAAWNLGLVTDSSDKALTAFVRRQTKIDHTAFLRDPHAAAAVIEALKGWMARDAGVDWANQDFRDERARVALAQWAILASRGLVEPGYAAFRAFVEDRALNPISRMTPREWIGIMNTLGTRVRWPKAAG